VGGEGRPGNYAEQARTYDRTRGASSTILGLLESKLGRPDGRSLIDIAGGTGNYALALQSVGFPVTVADASFEMLARSVDKIGPGRQVVADVMALPLADATFDCAVCVIAIHLFADRMAAFREARRVLRSGPFVVVAYARENLQGLFVNEYFGGEWPGAEDAFSVHDVVAGLTEAGFSSGVEAEPFVYADAEGGSLVAMHTDARLLADPDRLRNTSYWHRLPEEVREAGVARLAEDLRSGELDRRIQASLAAARRTGHGTVFTARP
jgi:SAM-dependent methyltransferase